MLAPLRARVEWGEPEIQLELLLPGELMRDLARAAQTQKPYALGSDPRAVTHIVLGS